MSVTCTPKVDFQLWGYTPKLKTGFYKQQNYFEKMMGIMLEWYHLLIGMQTTVLLTIVFRNSGFTN